MSQCPPHFGSKPILVKKTYQELWQMISQGINANSSYNSFYISQDDSYFRELPKSQELLTDNYMTFHNKIDYSNYVCVSPDQIKISNLYDCFHGILFFIYYNSENKLNTEELEFHYSYASKRDSLADLIQQNSNARDQYNILNIFDYQNIRSTFLIRQIKNAFFGITFKRIKVTPISYSVRSGSLQNNRTNLVSFVFEGYDEQKNSWDVLDERVNINDLTVNGGFALFYVHYTKKSYSSFKIRQTDRGSNGLWGFSLAAFDINGIITECDSSFQNDFAGTQVDHFDIIDPTMDMTDYLM